MLPMCFIFIRVDGIYSTVRAFAFVRGKKYPIEYRNLMPYILERARTKLTHV